MERPGGHNGCDGGVRVPVRRRPTVIWTQHPSNPIFQASLTWENSAVYEPSIVWDSSASLYRMAFSGGWGTGANQPAIGTATSADGVTWTKNASNPIISSVACRPHLMLDGSTWRIYYADSGLGTASIRMASSTDFASWTLNGVVFTKPSWATGSANTCVLKIGSTYYMVYEARASSPVEWAIGLATGTTPSSFTDDGQGRISSLDLGGGYGGPNIVEHPGAPGGYRCFFHAATSGDTPTDIYVSDALDSTLRSWTTPRKIVGRIQTSYQVDQVADPCFVARNGLLYYEGVDNALGHAAIGVAS